MGGGGISLQIGYFFYKFPDDVLRDNKHISQLECLNVLVSLRVFLKGLSGKTVKLFCDNSSTVSALQSGKCRDLFMASVLREVWFFCATNDIHLIIEHKAGSELHTADLLSRGFKTQSDWVKLCHYRSQTKLQWFPVHDYHLNPPRDNLCILSEEDDLYASANSVVQL